MRKHLKQFIGYYFLAASVLLLFIGETTTGLIIAMATLLKAPPFDWVGRYEDWLYRKMKVEERGKKLKANMDKRPKWQRWLYGLFVLILILLWVLFAPECELC